MRLSELDPHWVTWERANLGDEPKLLLGVSFLCPCCKRIRVLVIFENPIGATHDRLERMRYLQGNPLEDPEQEKWHREGDDFETLSLSPSVDGSASGHWHCYVTNGAIA